MRVNMPTQDYEPTKNAILGVSFKFWVAKGQSIPEGTLAQVFSWADYQTYRDNDNNWYDASNLGLQGIMPGDPWQGEGMGSLIYTNIDWDLRVNPVHGTAEDMVMLWQKHNYASYEMTVRNVSGMNYDKETDTYTLPDNPEEWVPDTTVFKDFNIQTTLPSSAGNAEVSVNASALMRFLMGADGSPVINDQYADANYKPSKTDRFTGVWGSNTLDNFEYDLSKYDEIGGVVIIDVTDVPEGQRAVEDPGKLVDAGGKLVGYSATGTSVNFESLNQILYPPHMKGGVKNPHGGENGEGITYDKDYPDARVYRVFVPYSNATNMQTSADYMRANPEAIGQIYFGPEITNKDEETGEVITRGKYTWQKNDKDNVTYFYIPEGEGEGEKVVEQQEAQVGRTLTYTIRDIGYKAAKQLQGANLMPPMYRPQITDELPADYDLEAVRLYVDPEVVQASNGEYIKKWLGGEDKLIGVGVIEDEFVHKTPYPFLQYLSKDGKTWVDLDTPAVTQETVTVGGKEQVCFTFDCSDMLAFNEDFYQNHTIRMNFKYALGIGEALPSNIELAGTSRVAGTRVNKAQVRFCMLDYVEEQQSDAIRDGLLTDQIGYFPVQDKAGNSPWLKKDSAPEKQIDPSKISGKLQVRTRIKKEEKVDDTELRTPLGLESGSYYFTAQNEAEGQGYNVGFTFDLPMLVEDDDLADGKKDKPGFESSGIYLHKQLIEAGDPAWKRDGAGKLLYEQNPDGTPVLDENGKVKLIEGPMLTLTSYKAKGADGKPLTVSFTKTELLALVNTSNRQDKDKHPDAAFIDLRPELRDEHGNVTQQASDLRKKLGQVSKIELTYSAFKGKSQLLHLDDEDPANDLEDQANQYMEILGTCYTISKCKAALSYSVDGWHDRFINQQREDAANPQFVYKGTDDGTLIYEMAKPTIDMLVHWLDDDGNTRAKANRQAVPYQDRFKYAATLGNDSTALMSEGEITLKLDLYPGDYKVKGLENTGFRADMVAIDMEHMREFKPQGWDAAHPDEAWSSDTNWANLEKVGLYWNGNDPDAKGAQPDLVLDRYALEPYIGADGVLRLPRTAWEGADPQKPEHLLGAVRVYLSEMDAKMVAAHNETMADGSTAHYDDKFLYCSVYGSANVYERDLAVQNQFLARSPAMPNGEKFVRKAADVGDPDPDWKGEPKDNPGMGVKKIYVDANPRVALNIYRDPALNLPNLGSSYTRLPPYLPDTAKWSNWYWGTLLTNFSLNQQYPADAAHTQYTKTWPTGAAEAGNTGMVRTFAGGKDYISAQLTNTDENGGSREVSDLLRGVYEVSFPARVNPDRYSRAEGFVTEGILIPAKDALSGGVDEIRLYGLDKSGNEVTLTFGRDELYGENGKTALFDDAETPGYHTLRAEAWDDGAKPQHIHALQRVKVVFAQFRGTVKKGDGFDVKLRGHVLATGALRVHASFYTEDERLEARVNNERVYDPYTHLQHDNNAAAGKNMPANRPATSAGKPAYYAEDTLEHILYIDDSYNLYVYSDAYYEAYQPEYAPDGVTPVTYVDANGETQTRGIHGQDRALMGTNQHDNTAYVPFNQHEKRFDVYIGSGDRPIYYWYGPWQASSGNNEKLPLSEGVLQSELPVKLVPRQDKDGNYLDASGNKTAQAGAEQLAKGFLFDRLVITDEQLKKLYDGKDGLFEVVFASAQDNKEGIEPRKELANSVSFTGEELASHYKEGEGYTFTLEDIRKKAAGFGDVRYVRVNVIDVREDTGTKDKALQLRLYGQTNSYTETSDKGGAEDALQIKSVFYRPERWNFETGQYETKQVLTGTPSQTGAYAGRVVVDPVQSGVQTAQFVVQRPHPYAYVQSVFTDRALADKGITPGNGASASGPNNWGAVTTQIDVPMGNLLDLKAYDRYQHFYKVTFGNQWNQSAVNQVVGGTNRSVTTNRSYSDLVDAAFTASLPVSVTGSDKMDRKGFLLTAIEMDPNILKYGKDAKLTVYRWDYDDQKGEADPANAGKFAVIDEQALRASLGRAKLDPADPQYAFRNRLQFSYTDSDGKPVAGMAGELPEGWYIRAVRLSYGVYFGNDSTAANGGSLNNYTYSQETNKQTYVLLEGSPSTYNDSAAGTAAQNVTYGGIVTATGNLTVPKGYDPFDFAQAKTELDTRTGSFRSLKVVPKAEVHAVGTVGAYKGQPSGDKGDRDAAMGVEGAFFRVKAGNTGPTRAYNAFLKNTLPISPTPVDVEGYQSLAGFKLTRIASDAAFLENITRDGKVELDSVFIQEAQPLKLDAEGKRDDSLPKPGRASVLIRRKLVDGEGNDATSQNIHNPMGDPAGAGWDRLLGGAYSEGYTPVAGEGTAYQYEMVYTGRDGSKKTYAVSADDLFSTDASGKPILSISETVWNDKVEHPIDHPDTANIWVTQYNSTLEGGNNFSPSKNSGYLYLYGTPDGYSYDNIDENGNKVDPGKDITMSEFLKLASSWTESYETIGASAAMTTYTRTVDSWARLHIGPSDPTVDMTAAKADDPADPGAAYPLALETSGDSDNDRNALPLSYEDKDGLFYRMRLGNKSTSAMSRPVLGVNLPLYGDNPDTNEQEDSRRGFQATGLFFDRKLIGDGKTLLGWKAPDGVTRLNGQAAEPYPESATPWAPPSYDENTGAMSGGYPATGWVPVLDEGVATVAEIRVYDRLATMLDAEGKPVPRCRTILGDELKGLLAGRSGGQGAKVDYTAWYDEADPDGEASIPYPGRIEIVFSRFDGDVKAQGGTDNRGEVRVLGFAGRYGDQYTYQKAFAGTQNLVNTKDHLAAFNPHTSGKKVYVTRYDGYGRPYLEENNHFGNDILAETSFIDYVSGTSQKVKPDDGCEEWKHASFNIKEPRPVTTARTEYYNRAALGYGTSYDPNPANTGGTRNDGTALSASIDQNGNWNVVPYAREYLSSFGLTNDSVSRMEGFRFTLDPGMEAARTQDAEGHRGFHTMDVIVRGQLFEQAVFDRIVLRDVDRPDDYYVEVTRDNADGGAPADAGAKPPYKYQKPATAAKALPETVNQNATFTVTLHKDGAVRTLASGLTRLAADKPSAAPAEGLYTAKAGDLLISRELLVGQAGLANIGKAEIYGSDFLPMRKDDPKAFTEEISPKKGKDAWALAVRPDQAAESVVFVGLSDRPISTTVGAAGNRAITSETSTVVTGTFETLLYGHGFAQLDIAQSGAPGTVTGVQDGENNFADIAREEHVRGDTDKAWAYTPKLYFDTTMSAAFSEDAKGISPADYRYVDETMPNNINRDSTDYCWDSQYTHAPYLDNHTLTVGYKSLAAYTVDFRQWFRTPRANTGTVLQDYNAAAEVSMTIDVPENSFDAYFLKLRPYLKNYVKSVAIVHKDGTVDTRAGTDWADGTAASSVGTMAGEDAGGWWRINLVNPDASAQAAGFAPSNIDAGDNRYDPRDTADAGSLAGYRWPGYAVQSGGIDKVIVTMSINENPAAQNKTNQSLWEVVAADEGSWYREAVDPQAMGEKYASHAQVVPNGDTVGKQETRHSIAVAGRVIKTGAQSASVNTHIALGAQYDVDYEANAAQRLQPVAPQNRVTAVREQIGKDDGQHPHAAVKTRSDWSYGEEYHHYTTTYYNYSYHADSNWADWQSGYLYNDADINVLGANVRTESGWGKTADGKAFSEASGNIRQDFYENNYNADLPYGALAGFGIGIGQPADTNAEKARQYYHYSTGAYRYLYDEWKGLFTQLDYVETADTLPELSREDGWYKGFFSRYIEVADNMRPYLTRVKVEIAEHETDTTGVDGAPPTGDVKTAAKATRTVTLDYLDLYGNEEAATAPTLDEAKGKSGMEHMGRILFRYEDNTDAATGDSIKGNQNLADGHTDDELDGDAYNDAVNADAALLAQKNVITLGRNEYPSKVTFVAVNLPGDGDQTDEYLGVQPERSQAADANPDYYLFGNVDEIIDDVLPRSNPYHSAWTQTGSGSSLESVGSRNNRVLTNAQVQPRTNHVSSAFGYLATAPEAIGWKDGDGRLHLVEDGATGSEPGWTELKESVPYKTTDDNAARGLNPVGGGVDTGSVDSRSMLIAKRLDNTPAVYIDTVPLLPGGTAAAGDPISSPYHASGAANGPEYSEIYDYGVDNKTPNTQRFRMWAVNTSKEGLKAYAADETLDTAGVYYDKLSYENAMPEGLRTQKLWIPAQFLTKTAYAGQQKATEGADDVAVLRENKYAVDTFTLRTAAAPNQTHTAPGASAKPTNEFDLMQFALADIMENDGEIAPAYSKYISYAGRDGNPAASKENARYFLIDLDKMFVDGASYTDAAGNLVKLTPVKVAADGQSAYDPSSSEGYFLQHNVVSCNYGVKVRTDWLIDFQKNRRRFFGPNAEGNATLTGVRNTGPAGAAAPGYAEGEEPADLLFEGVFVDRFYEADEDPAGAGTDKAWDSKSRPGVAIDPLKLAKSISDELTVKFEMAGVNAIHNVASSGITMKREVTVANHKRLRFLNRAAKLNVAVNRLPYVDAAGTSGLAPDPDAKDANNVHRPLGLSYGGNDFDKADANDKAKTPKAPVDIQKLIPGDRITYYVTAVNEKDALPTPAGGERGNTTWDAPVIRFEAPKGTRIARWYYMPEQFTFGDLPALDADGNWQAADGGALHIVNGKWVTLNPDGSVKNDYGDAASTPVSGLTAAKPAAASDLAWGDAQILREDITAYDPQHTEHENGATPAEKYANVPHNTELKDLYSGKESEAPTVFARMRSFFRAAFAEPEVPDTAVRQLVWQINKPVMLNQGVRIMVELEVESDLDTADDTTPDGGKLEGKELAQSVVYFGSYDDTHGYEPIYFTSTRLEAAGAGIADVENYTNASEGGKDVAAIPKTANAYGASVARQETIGSDPTVTYERLKPTAAGDITADGSTDGTMARVKSGKMKFFAVDNKPSMQLQMTDNIDGGEARLTVGTPNADGTTLGTIRNDSHRNATKMELTFDFIGGNTGFAQADLRELQGFFLNRLPAGDELLYDQTGKQYSTVSNPDGSETTIDNRMSATRFVQLRGDLKADGTVRDGWTDVAYDPTHPYAIRERQDGYRLVHPYYTDGGGNRVSANPNGYYWDEAENQYVPVDPRQVARLRLQYATLSAYNQARPDAEDNYLAVPAVTLHGVSVWADTDPNTAKDAYSYNYKVRLEQKWFIDSSAGDNFTTLEPGETTTGQSGKTDGELQDDMKDGLGNPTENPDRDDQNTNIEKDTYVYGTQNVLTYPVRRRMSNVSLMNAAYDTRGDAEADAQSGSLVDTRSLRGYRPGQAVWNRLAVQSAKAAAKGYTVTAAYNGKVNYNGGTALPSYSLRDCLGTGEVYRPTVIDKVPVDYVDLPAGMAPADVGAEPVKVTLPQDVIIRWRNADGTYRAPKSDANPDGFTMPEVTAYKVTEADTGGMQAYPAVGIDRTDAAVVPNGADVRTESKDFLVFTYTFGDADGTAALQPGERIEILYPAATHTEGLPMVSYQESGKNIYLPRIGEYQHNNYSGTSPNTNASYPNPGNTAGKGMDMDNLLHDVGFTGVRTGMKAATAWQARTGADPGSTVTGSFPLPDYTKAPDSEGNYPVLLYPDDTKQKRGEFLHGSTTRFPGNGGNSADQGGNGNFFDYDLDSQARQTCAVQSANTGVQEVQQLLPNQFNASDGTDGKAGTLRDWYSKLMVTRTWGVQTAAGRGVQPGKVVNGGRTALVDSADGKKENVLWSEDALHLQKAWLFGATQFETGRRYAGDINGTSSQYDLGYAGSGMPGAEWLFIDGQFRVYTPALQFGETYTAQLYAINYGDWATDGVTMTYVLPKGVMPKLTPDGGLSLQAYYGGAPAANGSPAATPLDSALVKAEIVQRPSGGVPAPGHRAAKSAFDPLLAKDFFGGRYETYTDGKEDAPWVVK
ncbi:hypothetical protein, partial [Intestinibacillus massiliensis]|uniref:hypothetical protein n=1 Tax=Intestinibacillus massiliensis TaxID=1871029 RepID=UPI0013562B4E